MARPRQARLRSHEAEPAGVAVDAMALVKFRRVEFFTPPDIVIRDHDAGNRSEQRTVADEPGKNVAAGVLIKLPWHHEDPEKGGDESAGAEADVLRGEVGEVVGRRDHVGRDVGRERGHGKGD